jgi:hypothetical protein
MVGTNERGDSVGKSNLGSDLKGDGDRRFNQNPPYKVFPAAGDISSGPPYRAAPLAAAVLFVAGV